MTLLERKAGSDGRKWAYHLNRRKRKKLIPVHTVVLSAPMHLRSSSDAAKNNFGDPGPRQFGELKIGG
jgi:hypothetical protein